ncbi:MAG: PAS domain-containing protein [Anaerolineales bacterium]|nr:PAS domain-containing protein [Anaerolineales bacterium]
MNKNNIPPKQPTDAAARFRQTKNALAAWRSATLKKTLWITVAAGFPVWVYYTFTEIMQRSFWPMGLILTLLYFAMIGAAALKNIGHRVRGWSFVAILYLGSLVAFSRGAMTLDGRVYLIALPAVVIFLIDERSGIYISLFSALTYITFGILAYTGTLDQMLIFTGDTHEPFTWIYAGVDFLVLLVIVTVLTIQYHTYQARTLETQQTITEELNEIVERSNAILAVLPDILFIHTVEGEYLYVHTAYPELLAMPSEELIGKNLNEVVPPEVAEPVLKLYRKAVDTREMQVIEYPLAVEEGELYFEYRIIPYKTDQVLGIVRDITDRHQFQEERRRSEERNREHFSNIPVPTIIVQQQGDDICLVDYNIAAQEITNGMIEKLVGESLRKFPQLLNIPKADINRTLEGIQRCLQEKQTIDQEISFPLTGNDPSHFIMTFGYLAPDRVILHVMDITMRVETEAALRKSQERNLTQFKSIPVPTYVWQYADEKDDLILVDFNDAALETTAGRVGGFVGLTATSFFENNPDILEHILLCYSEKRVQKLETTYTMRTTRQERYLQFISAYVPPDLVLVHTIDLTERMDAEAALRKSEQRYRAVVGAQTELICRWKPDATYTFVNEAYCRFFGKPAEYWIGYHRAADIHDDDRALYERHLESVKELTVDNPNTTLEIRNRLPNGEIRWLQWQDHALFDKAGNIVEYQSVGRDITELKNIQEALQNTNQQLQDLTRRVINSQETERQNLARDLHDDVLGQLGAMIIHLDDDTPNETVRNNYQLLIDLIRNTVQRLRPPMLSFGLYTGLAELVDELADRVEPDTEILLNVPPSDVRFDPEVEMHLFRVIQQACENAVRHSQASAIHIYGEITASVVDLTVRDNGIGFKIADELDVPGLLTKRHYGLAGMKERAALIGANIFIGSELGAGTKISLYWRPDYLDHQIDGLLQGGPPRT